MLGDVVEIRGWFKKESGIVAYIPGVSEHHLSIEENGPNCWLIRRNGGGFYSIGYAPNNIQPKKNIKFIKRGDRGIVSPDEDLGDP